MLYRIFTEDKRVSAVKRIVSREYPGFTLFKGRGYWQGHGEKSLVIDIVTEGNEDRKIKSVARSIKLALNQSAVLVERIKNAAWIV